MNKKDKPKIITPTIIISIICVLLIMLILLLIVLNNKAHAAVKAYGTMENTNTVILYYEIKENAIAIQYKENDDWYIYTEKEYGKETIQKMKTLALKGEGLNQFIIKVYNKENSPKKIEILPHTVYCGPQGGREDPHSYPIHTRPNAAAALSYAHWAPNPKGIEKCVCTWYPDFPSCKQ